jgi:hypothetical protein
MNDQNAIYRIRFDHYNRDTRNSPAGNFNFKSCLLGG